MYAYYLKCPLFQVSKGPLMLYGNLKKTRKCNVHWCSVPVQIGDPIVAPPGEYVCNKYRHPDLNFAIADTVVHRTGRRSDVDSWKTVHPSAKVTQEG